MIFMKPNFFFWGGGDLGWGLKGLAYKMTYILHITLFNTIQISMVGTNLDDQHNLPGYPPSNKIFGNLCETPNGEWEDASPLRWKRLKKSMGKLDCREIQARLSSSLPSIEEKQWRGMKLQRYPSPYQVNHCSEMLRLPYINPSCCSIETHLSRVSHLH
ncbi:unnamed protein product [Ilex paraguariensis]|uniref:Uncharacterized protein n=1 Tax=Ilex paraguariensis TaxID=185542 RepID=A0ABC8UJB7_9AQUA